MLQIRRGRRGRLIRHYFLVSVLLITFGLIISGLIEIAFRYQESRDHIIVLQQEVAAAAAFKIERFIREIEGMMKAATKSREIAYKGLAPEYEFELKKLLLVSPAITEAVALDVHGIERVQASRLSMVSDKTQRDLSKSSAFEQAKRGQSYFGPVYFVRGSEPYMTMAVPIANIAGDVIGVLQAQVNLKYILEVVSGLQVGKAGYAYAVNRSGDLIAHPNISLVLQHRNLAQSEQVKAGFQDPPLGVERKGMVAHNLQGSKVLSSYALIPDLDWAVFVERPLQEAYEPLYASVFRTSSLVLVGLGLALLASFFLARRVVGPLQTLRKGVERIGTGDLGFRLDVKTGDEIEILADEFNKMTSALEEAYKTLERKVAERTQELVAANQKLDEASRHKSQFLANVTHELRTPVHAIVGFTRLALGNPEGTLSELQKDDLQKVLISAEHLLKLINGLLDLSKIEAGKMDVFAEPVKLEEVIHAAISTAEPLLKDGHVRLTTEIASDLPPLNTDREKLTQIILNLLSNAVKFTERGEIKISAWQHDESLKLMVSDTGIGMKKEALEEIFEEFHQMNMASRRKYGGTGLGLAIVKRLVDLLGGRIAVDSEEGKGSKFTVTLPKSPRG